MAPPSREPSVGRKPLTDRRCAAPFCRAKPNRNPSDLNARNDKLARAVWLEGERTKFAWRARSGPTSIISWNATSVKKAWRQPVICICEAAARLPPAYLRSPRKGQSQCEARLAAKVGVRGNSDGFFFRARARRELPQQHEPVSLPGQKM
jgi:hypothetical protein